MMASLYKKSVDKNTEDKPTRYFSNRQEKSVAKKANGKKVANSGATAFSKGDVRTEKCLFECKTCTSDRESFSIKKAWLDKNLQESVFMGKDYSILAFSFGPDRPNYYILDELTFQEFIEYLENK